MKKTELNNKFIFFFMDPCLVSTERAEGLNIVSFRAWVEHRKYFGFGRVRGIFPVLKRGSRLLMYPSFRFICLSPLTEAGPVVYDVYRAITHVRLKEGVDGIVQARIGRRGRKRKRV